MIQHVYKEITDCKWRRTKVGLKIVQERHETTAYMLSPVRLWSSEIACDEDTILETVSENIRKPHSAAIKLFQSVLVFI